MSIYSLIPERYSSSSLLSTNCAFVHMTMYAKLSNASSVYIEKDGHCILLKSDQSMKEGRIMLSTFHRELWRVPLDGSYVTFAQTSLHQKAASVLFMVKSMGPLTSRITLDSDMLTEHVYRYFIDLPMKVDYKLALLTDTSNSLILTVGAITDDQGKCLLFSDNTKVNFQSDSKDIVLIGANAIQPTSNIAKTLKTFISSSQAEQLGIGGLDREFKNIVRRAFMSRMYPSHKIKELGLQHVKGMLLYGPPGTGKTLTAKTIGQLLNARPPKMISGPELLDKYVGGSEQKIRDLFADAYQEWREKGDTSELHIIIIDELDAVCKQRGNKSDSTGTLDSMVNQLLAMMDGPDAPDNILVIGMTNRKELIDKALLRPGRFEVHLMINLPNEEGRRAILGIHTKQLKNVMSADVNLDKIAHITANFSGAELAGLVRSAASFAMERSSDDIVINSNDFNQALNEVKAGYGSNDREILKLAARFGFLESTGYRSLVNQILDFGRTILNGRVNNGSVLITASSSGSGCTTICYEIVKHLGCEFVSVISAAQLIKHTTTEYGRVDHICQAFESARQVPRAVIILDGIESIIQYTPIGCRFSTNIMQTITALMSDPSPDENKIIVIATTSQKQAMEDIGINDAFDAICEIPLLTREQAMKVIKECYALENYGSVSQQISNPPSAIKKLLLACEKGVIR